jgi:hypothetical protein
LWTVSRASPPLISTPSCAPSPVPTITAEQGGHAGGFVDLFCSSARVYVFFISVLIDTALEFIVRNSNRLTPFLLLLIGGKPTGKKAGGTKQRVMNPYEGKHQTDLYGRGGEGRGGQGRGGEGGLPVGVARPKAHGQAVTRTDMKKLNASRNGDMPAADEKGKRGVSAIPGHTRVMTPRQPIGSGGKAHQVRKTRQPRFSVKPRTWQARGEIQSADNRSQWPNAPCSILVGSRTV